MPKALLNTTNAAPKVPINAQIVGFMKRISIIMPNWLTTKREQIIF